MAELHAAISYMNKISYGKITTLDEFSLQNSYDTIFLSKLKWKPHYLHDMLPLITTNEQFLGLYQKHLNVIIPATDTDRAMGSRFDKVGEMATSCAFHRLLFNQSRWEQPYVKEHRNGLTDLLGGTRSPNAGLPNQVKRAMKLSDLVSLEIYLLPNTSLTFRHKNLDWDDGGRRIREVIPLPETFLLTETSGGAGLVFRLDCYADFDKHSVGFEKEQI
ncbi:hypothetical protein FGRMN_5309 [Fusarium graminum]|nr:hypothetical protein FGRMN_5309 [Fusarium graminum]